MAALTPTLQKSTPQLKIEFVQVEAPVTGDTFTTLMQRPLYLIGAQQGTGGEMVNVTGSIAGKTVTIGVNAGGDSLSFIIFGF